jgi:hypothetical protein
MKSSEKIGNIAAALVSAQKAMTGAVKDSKNPFFNSSYADLESVIGAVKGPLNANGIAILQPLAYSGESAVITTTLVHSSGEWISSEIVIPKFSDMQKLGGAITYARRYSLAALCGLPQIDDDGNSTMDRAGLDQVTNLNQVKKTEPKTPAGFSGFGVPRK